MVVNQFQKLAMAYFHPALREDPFNPADNSRYFLLAYQYKDALDLLLRHIETRRGLAIIYGEAGLGKSSLLTALSRGIEAEAKSVVIGQIADPAEASDNEFTRDLLRAFGERPISSTRSGLSNQMIIFLQKMSREGRTPLLLVDEAQSLSYDALERLRIFLGFSVGEQRVLQAVLFGEWGLQNKIARKRTLAARQTVGLEPLPAASQVRELIAYRLKQAGLPAGVELFSDDAVSLIARHSGGVPRAIVNLCSACFDLAPSFHRRKVDAEIVAEVVRAGG